MNLEAAYIRYTSSLRERGGKPITFKILDVPVLKRHDIIVAVESPMNKAGFKGWKRRYMYLHLNRLSNEVFYLRPGVEPDNAAIISTDKIRIGRHGEFITL